MEDRKRLLSLPIGEALSLTAPPQVPVATITPTCTTSSGMVLKPKPILVDKQASEPNTPIAKNFDKPMQRGYSDLGHRIKKRVTLRYVILTVLQLI